MKRFLTWALGLLLMGCTSSINEELFPAPGARNVNPDTRLSIYFTSTPTVGTAGMVRVWDAATDTVVDSLDLSIPAGPTERRKLPKAPYTWEPYSYDQPRLTNADTKPGTPSGVAAPTSDEYQLTIIGGFTDGFHFHPILVRENRAEIYLHHNLLGYGKEYYVTIDEGVLTTEDGSFKGITKADKWRFKTKKAAPKEDQHRLTVNADGTGDFNTVQGALDHIPDFNTEPYTIFIHNGDYEELVYFRSKRNLTIEGESREGVKVHYPNNEVFNPYPSNVATNEWPGTFPSRRAAFMADNCTDLTMRNLTIATDLKGQAEGLLLMGERILLDEVTIIGSGDALQANGSVYLNHCTIIGDGDTILGRGPCFFNECELQSFGPFMWIRNTNENHGNVFVRCHFEGLGKHSILARTNPKYDYCEAVLIHCTMNNIHPIGWMGLPEKLVDQRYWEYDSRDTEGNPIDYSERLKGSRRLDGEQDKELIASYMDPAWVLGGWNPYAN